MTSGVSHTGQGPAAHVPVMLDEALAALAPQDGEVIVDGTFGNGSYSAAILAAADTRVIAIDRDPTAIAAGREMAAQSDGRLTLMCGRFSELDRLAGEAGHPQFNGVVLDVGVSSMQLDQAERGFSFRADGPLDMRMEGAGTSAADIVNTMPAKDLTRVLYALGEERRAGAIARAIVDDRRRQPFTRTRQLADLVERVVGRRAGDRIHPATRTFQALRVFVNRELQELAEALAAAERCLREGGRLVVVAFHSLEDRIVKRFLAERSKKTAGGSRHQPEATGPMPSFTLLTRRPVTAGAAEVAANPRSRSAKLRAAIRTAGPAHNVDYRSLGLPVLPEFAASESAV